tara:strand:+ start:1466 stop:2176 length:711 start_codon:yes stop_codon:yes gene_type:complete
MLRVVAFTTLLLLTSFSAVASSFTVDPVLVKLNSAKPTAALTLRNTEDRPLTIEVEALDWAQSDGEDSLSSSRHLIAVPPIFTLQGGEQQIVRVGLRNPQAEAIEQAFRLLFKEVPQLAVNGQGLRIALRVSLPVFVAPEGPAPKVLDWRARVIDGQILEIRSENHGAVHWRNADMEVLRKSDLSSLAVDKSLVYILPGTSRQWRFNTAKPLVVGDELLIITRNYGRTVQTRVVVE